MIRTLEREDARSVLEMEIEVFGPEAWSLPAIVEELTSPWSEYRGVFDDEGTLIAYGGIKGEREGDLMTLAVAPKHRRGGVGRRLVEDLMGRARQRGMRKIFLEVRESNDGARRLYESVGFEVVGLVPGYYRQPPENAVTMVAKPFP